MTSLREIVEPDASTVIQEVSWRQLGVGTVPALVQLDAKWKAIKEAMVRVGDPSFS